MACLFPCTFMQLRRKRACCNDAMSGTKAYQPSGGAATSMPQGWKLRQPRPRPIAAPAQKRTLHSVLGDVCSTTWYNTVELDPIA